MTLEVLGSGKVKVIFCRILTRLSALGNNAFKGNDGFSLLNFFAPLKVINSHVWLLLLKYEELFFKSL